MLTDIGWFLAGNQVEGDALEFGVFRGASLAAIYGELEAVFNVVGSDLMVSEGHHSAEDQRVLRRIWDGMRFFAFDSFQGLPTISGVDAGAPLFRRGKYTCDLPQTLALLAAAGVPLAKVVEVPGWYDETCTPQTRERLGLQRASIVHIDCDLHSSAARALEFITPLLQQGTILIFDDWFHFRGDPNRGEQLAFREWSSRLPEWRFAEFGREGAFRLSFVATRAPIDRQTAIADDQGEGAAS